MSFKSDNQTLSFSDLELSQTKVNNNTLEHLKNLDQSIHWEPIESTLVKNYPIGKNITGCYQIFQTRYPVKISLSTWEV
jgi:hypothetical protein